MKSTNTYIISLHQTDKLFIPSQVVESSSTEKRSNYRKTDSSSSVTRQDGEDDVEVEVRRKPVVRGDSVRALQNKFQQATGKFVESSTKLPVNLVFESSCKICVSLQVTFQPFVLNTKLLWKIQRSLTFLVETQFFHYLLVTYLTYLVWGIRRNR